MGLDISVLKNAKLIKAESDADGVDAELCERADVQFIYTLSGHESRLDGKPFGYYSGEDGHSFRAGSYGGYNEWRRWLCKAALGVPPEDVWSSPFYLGKPFVELIDFADNEGAIGPDTSRKLFEDFKTNLDRVDAAAATFIGGEDLEWFRQQYANWMRAFQEAAETQGFVEFS